MAGRERNPRVKNTMQRTPIWPRHFFPTSSVGNTRAHVPIVERPKPLTNLKAEYIHMLVEKAARRAKTDMPMQERKSIFFRPNKESASVVRVSPPIKEPRKNAEAGMPLTSDSEQSRPHSEMVEAFAVRFQAQDSLDMSLQISETELQVSLPSWFN